MALASTRRSSSVVKITELPSGGSARRPHSVPPVNIGQITKFNELGRQIIPRAFGGHSAVLRTGTIHGQAAWIRLRLAVSGARNTRLEHAPPSGVLISGLSSPAGAVSLISASKFWSITAVVRVMVITVTTFFSATYPDTGMSLDHVIMPATSL
jgi:hypothetical protein